MLSSESRIVAAILLIAVPTVEFGGLALLAMLTRRDPGFWENPLRRGMFRAGHAHAGVWIVLAPVAMLYVDTAGLSGGLATLARLSFAAAPILMPLGFFLSVARPQDVRPNRLILLVPAGGLCLAFGSAVLGIALLRS